jgi:hypothetical protein
MRLFRKDWTEEAECWCIGRCLMHWIRFLCLIKFFMLSSFFHSTYSLSPNWLSTLFGLLRWANGQGRSNLRSLSTQCIHML